MSWPYQRTHGFHTTTQQGVRGSNTLSMPTPPANADHHTHLCLIHSLTNSLAGWNKRFAEEAAAAANATTRNEREVDQIIEIFYHAGFADLAHSHAFICTIAAFVESLFKQELPHVGRSFTGTLQSGNERVEKYRENPASFWDPLKQTSKDEGIALRICEILKGAGITGHFGPDFERTATTIFLYRNKMVHNGYEWPHGERQQFAAKLRDLSAESWFSVATEGAEPWFFTATSEFQRACLALCDRSVLALEGLTTGDWERFNLGYEPAHS